MGLRLFALGLFGITSLSPASTEPLSGAQVASTPRESVRLAMQQRPEDPWPENTGHFVWAAAAAPLEEKGWFEAGGSFSPHPGSPGISLWVYGPDNRLEATSDRPTSPRQAFERIPGDSAPSVVFTTAQYQARWRRIGTNRWMLRATAVGEARSLAVAIRAVGPAAGPIQKVAAEGRGEARVDSCWLIKVRNGRIVFLGEDGAQGWRDNVHSAPTRYESPTGWAAVRIAAGQGGELDAEIEQTCKHGASSRWAFDGGLKVEPADLPIARIITNQSDHLLMGFVGSETRPGDPLDYPLQWLRDGGYSVVAMARAGRLDIARDLVTSFAELDFFGGFGSEADSPGISLWTISEVASAAGDPALDARLWPHVRRKADFIIELLNSHGEIRRPFVGPGAGMPDWPPDLVARGTVNGLIRGRMDFQEPLLFVNGFAWRGLIDAADIADRVGAADDSARWRDAARRLRADWRHAFLQEHLENERTSATLLWPTAVAAQDRELVQQLLAETAVTFAKRPEWTYFEIGRAHQMLTLGQVDRAWALIDSLVGLSSFPDIEVFWEGPGGEDDAWGGYRANVRKPPKMPHYWSASEAMLFAIEGLAFVDERPDPTLVIGAGIRREWLDRPITVKGVGTRAGVVDWSWDGVALTVKASNTSIPLALGPAFSPNTQVTRLPRPQ